MSSLEGVFACEHQREMNKNCQLPVHTRLKLNCWNKHLRSPCADLRFYSPGIPRDLTAWAIFIKFVSVQNLYVYNVSYL